MAVSLAEKLKTSSEIRDRFNQR